MNTKEDILAAFSSGDSSYSQIYGLNSLLSMQSLDQIEPDVVYSQTSYFSAPLIEDRTQIEQLNSSMQLPKELIPQQGLFTKKDKIQIFLPEQHISQSNIIKEDSPNDQIEQNVDDYIPFPVQTEADIQIPISRQEQPKQQNKSEDQSPIQISSSLLNQCKDRDGEDQKEELPVLMGVQFKKSECQILMNVSEEEDREVHHREEQKELKQQCIYRERQASSQVDQQKIKQNFQTLLGKVYAIIQDIQNRNEQALQTKAKTQQKMQLQANVCSLAVYSGTLTKNSPELIKENPKLARNPNYLKTIPKLELHKEVLAIKNKTKNLSFAATHRPSTFNATERLDTARSDCSRKSSKSKGISIVSAKKSKGFLNQITLEENKPCSNFTYQTNPKMAQSSSKGKKPESKQKKISLSQKTTFKFHKENIENEQKRTHFSNFTSNYSSNKKSSEKSSTKKLTAINLGNYLSTKRVSFRLF